MSFCIWFYRWHPSHLCPAPSGPPLRCPISIPVFVCLPRVRVPATWPHKAAAAVTLLSSILVIHPNHVNLFSYLVHHYLPVSQLLQCHLISDLVFPISVQYSSYLCHFDKTADKGERLFVPIAAKWLASR